MLSEVDLSFDIPDLSKTDKKAIDCINQYIRVGEVLRGENSAKAVEDAIRNEADDREGHFLAIVVPTFSGKTQMAFTIKTKLPLYFPLDETDPIYKNFAVLTQKLKEYAGDDREKMKKYLVDNKLIVRETDASNPKGSSYNYIAINDFRHLNEMKSRTLGLFMALIQDAETKPQQVDWMKHYSRPRKITVTPLSIVQFITHPDHLAHMQKYLVYLDDFYGDFDWLFVRNICRYLKFACMMTASSPWDISIMSKEESKKYSHQI